MSCTEESHQEVNEHLRETEKLWEAIGNSPPPKTWEEAAERLRTLILHYVTDGRYTVEDVGIQPTTFPINTPASPTTPSIMETTTKSTNEVSIPGRYKANRREAKGVGKQLRTARDQRGLSQRALASKLSPHVDYSVGTIQTRISRMERTGELEFTDALRTVFEDASWLPETTDESPVEEEDVSTSVEYIGSDGAPASVEEEDTELSTPDWMDERADRRLIQTIQERIELLQRTENDLDMDRLRTIAEEENMSYGILRAIYGIIRMEAQD